MTPNTPTAQRNTVAIVGLVVALVGVVVVPLGYAAISFAISGPNGASSASAAGTALVNGALVIVLMIASALTGLICGIIGLSAARRLATGRVIAWLAIAVAALPALFVILGIVVSLIASAVAGSYST